MAIFMMGSGVTLFIVSSLSFHGRASIVDASQGDPATAESREPTAKNLLNVAYVS
jgi:hypothetical protein